MTIARATIGFSTESLRDTIIDALVHRDVIKNMITGASQADVTLIMALVKSNFTTATQKENYKASEINGRTRQQPRLINLSGVKQVCICANKTFICNAKMGLQQREFRLRDNGLYACSCEICLRD